VTASAHGGKIFCKSLPSYLKSGVGVQGQWGDGETLKNRDGENEQKPENVEDETNM